MIKAEIVADSINKQNNKITTFLVTIPRFILAELNTHRMLSKNSASSRAIPFNKMVESVQNNPFIPIAFQTHHSGMQGTEYLNGIEFENAVDNWLLAKNSAIKEAEILYSNNVTKQLCNRLLEPFMWHTVLITATELENFFNLRCPQYEFNYYPKDRPEALEPTQVSFKSKKDALKQLPELSKYTDLDWLKINTSQAEIHIQALAECMWDALNESTPRFLEAGHWHVPFIDKIDNYSNINSKNADELVKNFDSNTIKIATAMAARTSYTTVNDEKEFTYEQQIRLHDNLLASGHCFDELTEILTNEGFKFIKNLNDNNVIAAVNTKTGEFNGFEKPIKIIDELYKGRMYKYNSKNIDLFCTEGHKLIGVPINKSSDRTKSYESIEIFEANKIRIKAEPTSHIKYKTYGEQELKMFSSVLPKNINIEHKDYLQGCLDGFFIGDGYLQSKNIVKFRLKKERKITYLIQILTKLNINYNVDIDKNNVANVKFNNYNNFEQFYNNDGQKTIRDNLNELYLYGLFDGLKNSDGSIKRDTWVYDTCSKELHDKILNLCCLVGLTGYTNPSYLLRNRPEQHNTHYRISFTTNNKILVNDIRTKNSKVEIVNYIGRVYCVEIPSHGIIIRRNGKTLITHNCSPFEHCAKAMTDEEYISFVKGKIDIEEYFFDNEDEYPNYAYPTALTIENHNVGWCRNFRGFISYRQLIDK